MNLIILLGVLALLVVIGYLVNKKMVDPGVATLKLVINFVLIVVAVILALSAFGVWDQVKNVEVPKI